MSTRQEILAAVMALQEDERLILMEQLLERLSPTADSFGDEEIAEELVRRDAEFENETAGGLSWEELRDEPI